MDHHSPAPTPKRAKTDADDEAGKLQDLQDLRAQVDKLQEQLLVARREADDHTNMWKHIAECNCPEFARRVKPDTRLASLAVAEAGVGFGTLSGTTPYFYFRLEGGITPDNVKKSMPEVYDWMVRFRFVMDNLFCPHSRDKSLFFMYVSKAHWWGQANIDEDATSGWAEQDEPERFTEMFVPFAAVPFLLRLIFKAIGVIPAGFIADAKPRDQTILRELNHIYGSA